MKNRIIKAAFAAMLNQASLLCAGLFAVIANSFRCSAFRLRCSGITAKTQDKALIEKENISSKSPENGVKNFLSLFFPCLGSITGKRAPYAWRRGVTRKTDARCCCGSKSWFSQRREGAKIVGGQKHSTRQYRSFARKWRKGLSSRVTPSRLCAFARTKSRASEARPGQRYSWRGRPGQAGRGKIRPLRRPAPLPALPRARPRATP